MKILVTGANGYIGKRLIPVLAERGYKVYALVRDPSRLHLPSFLQEKIKIVRADLSDFKTLAFLPTDIDAVYYLVHSLSTKTKQFIEIEQKMTENFVSYLTKTTAKQIIYLGGLAHEKNVSPHLQSRLNVETILKQSSVATTILRAGIIIGSGSASFEIMRDLVEKLPIMVAPKWVHNKCQPIAISDAIDYLVQVLKNPACYHKTFDIGGPDIFTYKELLLELARVRHLKRYILTVPVLTPRLSSYWLFFVTSTNFTIAKWLVDSLKQDAICTNHEIQKILPKQCTNYVNSIQKAFAKIEENAVISSWKDSFTSSNFPSKYNDYIEVPTHGCLIDQKLFPFKGNTQTLLQTIWSIGGKKGWYGYSFFWKVRGFLDKLFGGVGLRRGRTDPLHLSAGDALDFWRVLLADQKHMRLLLYAEMKLPGEAWLEFHIRKNKHGFELCQTATFRPIGVLGRLYWYILYPFHHLIFNRMGKTIIKVSNSL